MTELPERIWAKRGFAKCCDGVWDEPVDMDGNPMGDEDMDDDDTPYLRADTAIPKAEADAMVAAAYRDAAETCEHTAYSGKYPICDDVELGCLRCRDEVKTRTPADARTALEQAVQEAVEAALEDAARWCEHERQVCNAQKDRAGAVAYRRLSIALLGRAAIRGEPTE